MAEETGARYATIRPSPKPTFSKNMPDPAAPPASASNPLPSTAAQPPERRPARWLTILAWSTGPAAVYALLGLLHAAVVERILNLDVAFGQSLAFWVGAAYIALPLWGFLPRTPAGWYARRRLTQATLAVGVAGAAICGGVTIAWLVVHWRPSVAIPALSTILVLLVAMIVTLWYASRQESEPRA
jgi:hypothetical protein